MHARGLRSYTLDKWQINEGGFTLKVQFANARDDARVNCAVLLLA